MTELLADIACSIASATSVARGAQALAEVGVPLEVAHRVLLHPTQRRRHLKHRPHSTDSARWRRYNYVSLRKYFLYNLPVNISGNCMTSYFKCGLCRFECEHGARVCQGCRGTVIYGATADELKQGAALGGMGGFMLGAGFLGLLPEQINKLLGTSIANGFGLSFGTCMLLTAGFTIVAAGIGWRLSQKASSGAIRTFR